MGLFNRGDRQNSSDDDSQTPDSGVPFMTEPQAARLRTEVSQAFAERGLEVTVHPDHVVDSSGRQFGLHNVAAACHGDPDAPDSWPSIVRDHVTRVLAGMDDQQNQPVEEMDVDELRASTVVRLVERASIPASRMPDYAVDFSDDVVETLFLDRPDTVELLQDASVERLGGRMMAREQAMLNLASIIPTLEVHHMGNEEVGVTFIGSDSVFAASTVLLLPDLLKHAELGRAPDGVFVATPNRSEVPLRDARSIPSLQTLAQMAKHGFDEGVGPLSPHVHWWDGTSFTQLTRIDDDGVRIEVGPELGETLTRISE